MRLAIPTTEEERAAALSLRRQYFLTETVHWDFAEEDYTHLIFYEDDEIVGYAHIQFVPPDAILRVLIIDEPFRYLGYGKRALTLCEKYLINLNINTLYLHSTPEASQFYIKLGYKPLKFADPDGILKQNELEFGKILIEKK